MSWLLIFAWVLLGVAVCLNGIAAYRAYWAHRCLDQAFETLDAAEELMQRVEETKTAAAIDEVLKEDK